MRSPVRFTYPPFSPPSEPFRPEHLLNEGIAIRLASQEVLERVQLLPTSTPSEDLVTIELASCGVERVRLEDGPVHVSGEDEGVGVTIVSSVIAASDVAEGALARAELLGLNERDLLTEAAPKFGVVLLLCRANECQVVCGFQRWNKGPYLGQCGPSDRTWRRRVASSRTDQHSRIDS